VEIKCQLDETEVFIADLIACSTCFGHHYAHHQEIKIIIQWLLPVVFLAVVFKLLVWCGAEGYVCGLQDVAALFDYFPLKKISKANIVKHLLSVPTHVINKDRLQIFGEGKQSKYFLLGKLQIFPS